MSTKKLAWSKITSAEDKVAGFDYQYYYFLYLLLHLKVGESIGLEVKDDVHLVMADKSLVLIQLKHTIAPDDSNLTERGKDLWKTIYNWVKVITDPTEGRADVKEQIAFCFNTSFILVTNKLATARNKFIINVENFQNGKTTIEEFVYYINELNSSTSDEEIEQYTKELLSLNQDVLSLFLKNLSIELGVDDIIQKIKVRLKELFIPKHRIDDVLSVLEGNLRRENYINAKERKCTLISFEEFYKKYGIVFDIGRSNKLITIRDEYKISNPLEQRFVKQLIDIEDIEEDDVETILKYSTTKLRAANNLSRWLHSGDVTELELKSFENISIDVWENFHKSTHRKAKALLKEKGGKVENAFDDFLEMAHKCLTLVRAEDLKLGEQHLDRDISNGHFYRLSDDLKIGWLHDWKTRYKVNGK